MLNNVVDSGTLRCPFFTFGRWSALAHFLSEPRIWSVYVHTNKQNGKRYVGITSAKPERRWNNGLGYLQCSAMNNAIRKYGWDGFEHFVFPDKYTKTEACLLERILIKSLHSNVNENGYNIDIGGSCGASGRVLSEETKRKISQNHADISGDKCYWYGKKRSSETKAKISANKKLPASVPVEIIRLQKLLFA